MVRIIKIEQSLVESSKIGTNNEQSIILIWRFQCILQDFGVVSL